MSKSAKRTRGLYDPKSREPFKVSRSKIELFTDCPRCFYFDRRLGIGRPGGMTFSLNNAVDALLKKEFDIHRLKGKAHPLMTAYKINAIPFAHEDLDVWRINRKGIQYLHEPTNFIITGSVDDIWINSKGELLVVDYKATSTSKEITLEDETRQGYKRQLEIYQWLLKKNGFKVSNDAYLVYVNGKTDKEAFDAKLEFDVQIIHHKGDNSWVENSVIEAHKCLQGSKIPKESPECEYCPYVNARREHEI